MPTIRRAPKKTSTRSPKINVAPRILSADEKHELILAHAAARKPVDPIQRVSLWAGVAVCVVFIVGAWFYTVGSGIQNSLAGPPDPNTQQMVRLTGEFVSNTASSSAQLQHGFQSITERLDQLNAEQKVLNRMADTLNGTSTATSTNLFKPQPNSSTTTSPTTL